MDPIVSDTGELRWQTDDGKDGLVTINTPRSQALVGFVSANEKVQTRNLSADIANTFATITLSSLDDKPLNLSDRMLRSEEHTSELQSLMRTSYAVFCLKNTDTKNHNTH